MMFKVSESLIGSTPSRRVRAGIAAVAMLSALLAPLNAVAADEVTLELWPHCTSGELETQFGGPLPDTPFFTKLTETKCRPFQTKDPLTRQTDVLQAGDTLDMDLILRNRNKEDISRFRAWMAYDPTLLEGVSIDINPVFNSPTPGEEDFSDTEGYMKIGASADTAVADDFLAVARIRMKVLDSDAASTVISFYDVSGQEDAHAAAITGEDEDERNVLASPLGSLIVRLTGDGAPAGSSAGNADEQTASSMPAGVPPAASSLAQTSVAPTASSAPTDTTASSAATSTPAAAVSSAPSDAGAVFPLLQVQNLRATTEGSTVFLAWDPLNSSQLAGYNIYYGKQSGQYINRHTVDKNSTTLTLRGLPVDTTYYFAVRAFNAQQEESEFSKEVGITVGNPASSTSPLSAAMINPGPQGNAPGTGGTISGETGVNSSLLLLLLASAVIGTGLAFRRQFSAATSAAR